MEGESGLDSVLAPGTLWIYPFLTKGMLCIEVGDVKGKLIELLSK
jgi:hypothetical protein